MKKPDLALIYSQLDLQPDCTLEEFQCACRRRIAQLHPDRNGVAHLSSELQSHLRSLISLHATVTRFHRRYGRMPGASHLDASPRKLTMPWRSNAPASHFVEGEPQPPSRTTLTLAILFVALLVLVASWGWLTSRAQLGPQTQAPGSIEPNLV